MKVWDLKIKKLKPSQANTVNLIVHKFKNNSK